MRPARSRRSPARSSAGSTWRSERPTVPLRRRGPPAGLPRRKGAHPAGDRRSVLGPSGQAPPLRLVDDAGSEHRQLAVVLVPNNPYALDRPPPSGTRPALDTGQLGIVVLD